ncbi:MAG: DUF6930 domain-containing protein, partial [Candidatus Rokuibacteriota bacterium]
MTGGEWVGGGRSAPFYVMEDGPQRPDIILWVDAPSGLIVGMHLDRPGLGPKDIAECLARAIERPQAQVLPPASIRVADTATAAAVRARLGEETRVIVGPTPEVD